MTCIKGKTGTSLVRYAENENSRVTASSPLGEKQKMLLKKSCRSGQGPSALGSQQLWGVFSCPPPASLEAPPSLQLKLRPTICPHYPHLKSLHLRPRRSSKDSAGRLALPGGCGQSPGNLPVPASLAGRLAAAVLRLSQAKQEGSCVSSGAATGRDRPKKLISAWSRGCRPHAPCHGASCPSAVSFPTWGQHRPQGRPPKWRHQNKRQEEVAASTKALLWSPGSRTVRDICP